MKTRSRRRFDVLQTAYASSRCRRSLPSLWVRFNDCSQPAQMRWARQRDVAEALEGAPDCGRCRGGRPQLRLGGVACGACCTGSAGQRNRIPQYRDLPGRRGLPSPRPSSRNPSNRRPCTQPSSLGRPVCASGAGSLATGPAIACPPVHRAAGSSTGPRAAYLHSMGSTCTLSGQRGAPVTPQPPRCTLATAAAITIGRS